MQIRSCVNVSCLLSLSYSRYHARIVKINESNHRVLVHFDGWNSRHDKWFDHKSDLLRPLSSGEQKQHEADCRKVFIEFENFQLLQNNIYIAKSELEFQTKAALSLMMFIAGIA